MGNLNPGVILTVLTVGAMTFALTMAVVRWVQNPIKRMRHNEALAIIRSEYGAPELAHDESLDLALTKTDDEKRKTWFEFWYDATIRTGRIVDTPRQPGLLAIGVFVFSAAVGVALLRSPIGLLVGFGGVFFRLAQLRGEARRRLTAMERQLPDMLTSIEARLRAQATPHQAIAQTADELSAPLGDELRMVKRDMEVNMTMDEALRQLAARVPSREMQFLVSSIEISQRHGADLPPLIRTLKEIIRQRTRIRQRIATAIASVRPTQYIAYLAVPGIFMYTLKDELSRDFWFSFQGGALIALVAVVILYVGSILLTRMLIQRVENR